jgi:hypothetical protein
MEKEKGTESFLADSLYSKVLNSEGNEKVFPTNETTIAT